MAERGNTMINIAAMEADLDDGQVIVGFAASDDGDVYIEVAKENPDDPGHPVRDVKKRHAFYVDVVQLLNAFVDVGVISSYETPEPPPPAKK